MCFDKLLLISVGLLLINVPSSSQTFDTSGERTVVEELDGNSMDSVNQDSLRMKREANENADVDTNKEQLTREKRSDEDNSGSQPNNLSEDNMLAEINRLLLEKRDANVDVDFDDKEDLSREKHDADGDDEEDDDEEDDNDDDEEDEDDDVSLTKRDEDGTEDDDDDVDDGYDDDDDEDGYSRRKRYLSDDMDEPEEEYDDDVDDLSEEKRDIDDDNEDDDDEDDDNEEDDYDMFDDDNGELQRRDTDVKDERQLRDLPQTAAHLSDLTNLTHTAQPLPKAAPAANSPVQPRQTRDLEDEDSESTDDYDDYDEDDTDSDNVGVEKDMGIRQAPQQEHIKRKRWMQNTHSTIEKQLVPIILQRQAQGQRLTPREKQLLHKHSHIFKPSPGVGPIAEKYILQQKFRNAFANNPQAEVHWQEPRMLSNCWIQSMLSSRYGFSPNCNQDGTFGPKQCFLQRCWCVNKNGSPQEIDKGGRFHYKIDGAMLRCQQNYK